MTIQPVIKRAWQYINSANWVDPAFTLEKAYVCALYSKLAYLHVPLLELANHHGIKIVPCLTYQAIAGSSSASDIRTYLAQAEFTQFFPIEGDSAVIVAIKTPKVVIVAIRGTRPLYVSDWMTDL